MIDLKERAGVAMSVRGQFTDPIADPKVTLGALAFANDLGRLLTRIKAGPQATPAMIRRATLLLAQMIRTSGRFKRARFTGYTRDERRDQRSGHAVERANVDIVERFALRLLDEWVNDQCVECEGRGVVRRARAVTTATHACDSCGGSGKVCVSEERIPFFEGRSGPVVFREYEPCDDCGGMGRIAAAPAADAKGRHICPECSGSGRRQIDDAGRAHALGISLIDYRRNWSWRFHDMLALLDSVDGSVSDTMRRQLRG
ncbi:zinc finger-like domain-containing protein [Burkholderia gladioli]|uniref:zinc finger-like domain-containing protein n=1 Tax=Burkholderia gladioli TaxID=28095 RepID=UPI00264B7C8F|nr:zinc finger-like domain-containing protein [Burkholderia gladioli]MDN7717829.1 zinc finger-like domain-containing protein [Burkholderia gladioli]